MCTRQNFRLENSNIGAYILALVITFLVGHSNPSSATITPIQNSKNSHKCPSQLFCFEISGQITQSDNKELARAVALVKEAKAVPLFRLNSAGGDVEVAIAIGRELRRMRATAITWDDGQCSSSCVFILAGAVRRILSKNIGIHRPYSSRTDNRDYQAIQLDQRQLAKFAKDYLHEVNVSPSLYDAMISIPPEKIKLLSDSELDSYGLLKLDPVEQELDDSADARKYGLTKLEYLRRKAQISITCANEYGFGSSSGDFDSYNKCSANVLSTRK